MGETQEMIRTYDAVPASVPEARHTLEAFAAAAGATNDELDSIRLVTSEALTNVVVHVDLLDDQVAGLPGDDDLGLGQFMPGLDDEMARVGAHRLVLTGRQFDQLVAAEARAFAAEASGMILLPRPLTARDRFVDVPER